VFSKHATSIELLLFDDARAKRPSSVIALDPRSASQLSLLARLCARGLKPGQVYAYRAHGPFEPERGLRFDGQQSAARIHTGAVSRFRRRTIVTPRAGPGIRRRRR
jgi:pullulanase/glycogen debranching enzyme